MSKKIVPDVYIGKEQAFVKHTILKTYLQRLFMIVGRNKELVINYVDCMSGPWQEEDDNLRDTSIGVSLEQMFQCQTSLSEQFSRKVSFRALYIEKDPLAFIKLKTFLSQKPFENIETKCLCGNYTDLLEEICDWCGSYFTFFFIDPTGWKKVVGAETMLPLLKLGKAEFLINLMYDFINRFVGLEKHAEDMIELFGKAPSFSNESPEERQDLLLALYRKNMNAYYEGRTAFVPVNKAGTDRVLYYLIYMTRHPMGIDVFKSEAEKMQNVQRITQKEYQLRRQIENSPTNDLFPDEGGASLEKGRFSNNKYAAKEYLLDKLSKHPIAIDHNRWAELLEETDYYPSDFQEAMKDLIKEKKVRNLDADVSKRRSKIIQPNWKDKSERWVLT